jgi:predicted O-methyltransferase YrrM
VTQETWTAVDQYVTGLLAPPDEALEKTLGAVEAAGLPQIQVSPPQGKLLYLLAKTIGARSILEFGTLAATARSGLRGRCRRMAA